MLGNLGTLPTLLVNILDFVFYDKNKLIFIIQFGQRFLKKRHHEFSLGC
jgi:hypothetical protein